MSEYTLNVTAETAGKRLDVFLMDFIRESGLGVSRTYLQELIDSGRVRVKDAEGARAHYKVREGQEILLDLVEKQARGLEPEDIPLDIVYEDADLAVINKPAGLVVHPSPGNREHTLVNALLFSVKRLSSVNPERPGIVHRLDKDTSGIMVVAKTNAAHLELARQFEEHSIVRRYVALVKGGMEYDEDVIEAPINRDPERRENMKVDFSEGSRYAKTRYRVLARGKDFTFVELEPFTGRTHQLRVHMAYIGHPILGDAKYGRNNPFCRMALHARDLGFIHPAKKKYLEFTSTVPAEIAECAKKCPGGGSAKKESGRKRKGQRS